MKSQKQKTALITGASTGIGKALAFLLAEQGYQLILMARREDLLIELKKEIFSKYLQSIVEIICSDVADFSVHMSALTDVCKKIPSLDLVIANAGIGHMTDESKNTWEWSKKIIDVNFLGAIATLEAAKDIMLRQGHGHLVGISSVAAVRGMNLNSAYNASKAGLSTFLESMRLDLFKSGITVTAVHPGFVATPLTAKNGKMPWLISPEKAAQIIFKAICQKKSRVYFPWQMALVVCALRFMPNCIYDFVMSRQQRRAKAFKLGAD